PTPLADPHHEEFDLEISGRLPLTEHFENSFLSVLVFHRRTLRPFEPADYVLHWYSPYSSWYRSNDYRLDGPTGRNYSNRPTAATAARQIEGPYRRVHFKRVVRRHWLFSLNFFER